MHHFNDCRGARKAADEAPAGNESYSTSDGATEFRGAPDTEPAGGLSTFAWFCWWAPAAVGVSVTALPVATAGPGDMGFFLLIALLNVFWGVICFVIGAFLTLTARRGPRLLLFVLLLSNFPLALACMGIGFGSVYVCRADVCVTNKSRTEIEFAMVTFGQRVWRTEAMPVGGKGRVMRIQCFGGRDDMILSVGLAGKQFSLKLGNFDEDDLLIGHTIDVEVFDDGIRLPERRPRPQD